MQVGDLVKLGGVVSYAGVGLVLGIQRWLDNARQMERVRVVWLDGVMGFGSYTTDELEVLSESR